MIDGIFVELLPETGWRLDLGIAAVPALIMYRGFQRLPESPRWLVEKGRIEEAEKVLKTFRNSDQEAIDELVDIKQSVARPEANDNGAGADGADPLCNNGDYSEEDDNEEEMELEYGTSLQVHDSRRGRRRQHHHILNANSNKWSSVVDMLSDAPTRRALILGCGLMAVQQFSGINTYVPIIDIET